MRTLLLADENITVQRVIALTFAREPFRVVTASDGQQAIDRMAAHRPDIVLAGTTLPHVSGYELARYVRSRPELKNVPVLLLSGAFETVDEAQLMTSGASGILEKPVEPRTLINRVKELLGLTPEAAAPAPAAGRLVTSAHQSPDGPKPPPPVAPRALGAPRSAPSPWDQQPNQLLEAGAKSVEEATGRTDYLESLGPALDTLDQHLAGRTVGPPPRNPSGPPGQTAAAGDPRSPGRSLPAAEPPAANPVYEVDDEWFSEGGKPREDARAARRETPGEMTAVDAAAAMAGDAAAPIYEVDAEWFAEDEKARAVRDLAQKQLAAEMGIHEVEVVAPPPVMMAPPPVPSAPLTVVAPPPPVAAAPPSPPVVADPPVPPEPEPIDITEELAKDQGAAEVAFAPEPIARTLPLSLWEFGGLNNPANRKAEAPAAPAAPATMTEPGVPALPVLEPIAAAAPTPATGDLADDFAALLAYEQGEKASPPMAMPIIHTVTPEITPEMLEQIATTVAERLKDSVHVEPLAPEITDGMLEQIAGMVSERLQGSVHVEPVAPPLTEAMLADLAARVAEQLAPNVRVEPQAPEITGAMLDHIAGQVSERVQASLAAEQLRDSLAESIGRTVRDIVRDVVSETSERLVRDEIERIKSKAAETPHVES